LYSAGGPDFQTARFAWQGECYAIPVFESISRPENPASLRREQSGPVEKVLARLSRSFAAADRPPRLSGAAAPVRYGERGYGFGRRDCRYKTNPPYPPLSGGYKKAISPRRRVEGVLLLLTPLRVTPRRERYLQNHHTPNEAFFNNPEEEAFAAPPTPSKHPHTKKGTALPLVYRIAGRGGQSLFLVCHLRRKWRIRKAGVAHCSRSRLEDSNS